MGLFDRFRKKAPEAAPGEFSRDEPTPLPCAVVVLREGMSPPSDEEMGKILAATELAGLPRRGLAQPRWWRQNDWVPAGMRAIAAALSDELGVNPDETTWKVTTDERGAKIAIVSLYPR